ncbi:MAG: AbrB/MazE/SpoVT family DNA-binding domain-containing protein [Gemmatimonadetes bacterium]|jgi:AbrB family looped-hinge helix DNA binding protein|nr:AbrB/MazE/SpoVT family DNA-binding domain-containing protein [Gemmatimonadota bacterium]
METVKVDEKGRVLLPASIRDRAGIHPGDVYFIATEDSEIRLAKAVNPFDALAEHAIEEYTAGKTRSLRDYAEDKGFDLDAE